MTDQELEKKFNEWFDTQIASWMIPPGMRRLFLKCFLFGVQLGKNSG